MQINVAEELYKGLSDLPIIVVAFLFALLLLKEKKSFSSLFFKIGFSSLLGAFVHSFVLDEMEYKILWSVLYVMLYEVIWAFRVVIVEYISGKVIKRKDKFLFLEIALYILSIILLWLNNPLDIYLVLVFATAMIVNIFYQVRGYMIVTKVKLLFLAIVLAVISQAGKSVIPFGVVLGHFFMLLALLEIFMIAKGSNNENC